MSESLNRLVEWYCGYCDGLWEHSYGISIETLDNPGFRVEINLVGTDLEHLPFQAIDLEMDPDGEGEWISCSKSDDARWLGACSPRSLDQTLKIFLDWSSAK